MFSILKSMRCSIGSQHSCWRRVRGLQDREQVTMRCGREGIQRKNVGDRGGELIVRMGWCPDGTSACYLSLHHKIKKMTSNNGVAVMPV